MTITPLRVFVLTVFGALYSCTCQPAPCTAGTADCVCKAEAQCNDGLQCTENKCLAVGSASVNISDPAARACELVISETSTSQVQSVSFKNGVRGTFIRQAPQVAVTFVSSGDVSPASGVDILVTGTVSSLVLSKVSCVDVNGRGVAATVSLK